MNSGWYYDARTRTYHPRGPDVVGAPIAPAPAPPPDPPPQQDLFSSALRQITPTLILVGIATGASFALGSALVHHIFFKNSSNR